VAQPSFVSGAGERSGPPELRAIEGGSPVPIVKQEAPPAPSAVDRLFGSPSFFRLWLAQGVSSLGDWIGFIAITALAARIGGRSPEGAVSLVLSARLVPGFFLAPVAGVFVDRWDRRRVMVACDVGRGLVLAALPFARTIPVLVAASFVLEILTLMWAPAKEASVPNLVPTDRLASANSLSLAVAYGTFPVASALFAFLAKVAQWLGGIRALHILQVRQESVALWVDVLTFFVSATLIATLSLPRRAAAPANGHRAWARTFDELRDGWRFIVVNPVVRAVILGLGTGLIGGAMVVPLGPVMSKEVFGAGTAGFGVLLTALGTGLAVGIVGLSAVQRRLPHERIFVAALLGSGAFLVAGASMSSLATACVFVAGMGVCAGTVYVLGFSILQANVGDDLRGRVFATLYTLIRVCALLAFTLAPLLASLLDSGSRRLVGGHAHALGLDVALPGVRLTLWLGGVIILAAGLLARFSVRAPARARSAASGTPV
jgi:dTMP kinase